MPTIQQTLGNQSWVEAHLPQLRNMFPVIPTKLELSMFLSVGFKIKVLGVEWYDQKDLPKIFSFLQQIKIIDIKLVAGEAYVARCLSPAEADQMAKAQAAQKAAAHVNRTEPPKDIKAIAAGVLNRLMKG